MLSNKKKKQVGDVSFVQKGWHFAIELNDGGDKVEKPSPAERGAPLESRSEGSWTGTSTPPVRPARSGSDRTQRSLTNTEREAFRAEQSLRHDALMMTKANPGIIGDPIANIISVV